jgi:hypothetical protein
MKRKETLLASNGIDAIKIRDGEFRSYLVIGQPALDAANAIKITPRRATMIAKKLVKWAEAKGKR